MSFTRNHTNGFWPYEEDVPIVHYEHFLNYDQTITLSEGNTYHCGKIERIVDIANEAVLLIYYICSTTPHTHTELPSCNRFIMCLQRHGREKG